MIRTRCPYGHDLEPHRLRLFNIIWNIRTGPLDKIAFYNILGVDIRPGDYAP